MKQLVIKYSDKKDRNKQRTLTINVSQIRKNDLSLSEMDFCDRIAENYKKITEDIMSWRIEDDSKNN